MGTETKKRTNWRKEGEPGTRTRDQHLSILRTRTRAATANQSGSPLWLALCPSKLWRVMSSGSRRLCHPDPVPTRGPARRIQWHWFMCFHSEMGSSSPSLSFLSSILPSNFMWLDSPFSHLFHSEDRRSKAVPNVPQRRKATKVGREGKEGVFWIGSWWDISEPHSVWLIWPKKVPSEVTRGGGSTSQHLLPSIWILLAALTSLEKHF